MGPLFVVFTAQPSIGISGSDGQLGFAFHDGFAVLGETS
jgi:hypothetical protein